MKKVPMEIELESGERVKATHVRHLSTLTGDGNVDVELYRLPDGTEIACESDASDARSTPVECDW